MHKMLAKYWQNYIFITTFCQILLINGLQLAKMKKSIPDMSLP